jgi:two-component system, NtrC family, sensor kinase
MAALPVRLAVFVVLPLVALVLVGGGLIVGALEGAFEHRLQREVQMVARALRVPVGEALREKRTARLERTLESALSIGRVYGAHVYDERGRIVASVGHGGVQETEQVGAPEPAQRGGGYEHAGGKQVYAYFVPLLDAGDRVIGTLQVTRKRRDFEEFMARIRVRGFFLIGAGLLLVLVVVILGYHGAIGRSLLHFTASIRRVEEGDREHRASIRRPNEVAVVANSFNAMLDSMAVAQERVREEQASRAKLERELRQSEKLAAVGRLATGLAHELGTPLSVVDGHAQRALRATDLEPALADRMRTIRREVERMSTLVAQLLDYGRTDPRRHSPVSAEQLTRSTVAALEHEADAHGVSVEIAQRDDVTIVANEARLQQALVNLVKNAIHAARGHVRIAWREHGERVELVVEDDGLGVAPEACDRLFEPFFTTKDVHEGTGLGLSIVHSVATEHGGAVSHGRAELGGARFVFAVPPGQAASSENGGRA